MSTNDDFARLRAPPKDEFDGYYGLTDKKSRHRREEQDCSGGNDESAHYDERRASRSQFRDSVDEHRRSRRKELNHANNFHNESASMGGHSETSSHRVNGSSYRSRWDRQRRDPEIEVRLRNHEITRRGHLDDDLSQDNLRTTTQQSEPAGATESRRLQQDQESFERGRSRGRDDSSRRDSHSSSSSSSKESNRHGSKSGRHSKESHSRHSHKHSKRSSAEGSRKRKHKERDRSGSRERDKKRRKKKEKEHRHAEGDGEERRSVLTGKKIKLKVKKDKFDHERDANREKLLHFLNSTFE